MPVTDMPMLILVDQKTNKISEHSLNVEFAPASLQTSNVMLDLVPNDDYTLILAFPMGRGSFSIDHVYLTKADYGAPTFPGSSPANPAQR